MTKDQAEAAIRNATRAAKRGDLAEAERWSKTADRLVAAAEKLSSLPKDEMSAEEEQALRQDFLARLRRLVDVNQEGVLWQAERDLYERQCAEARAAGAEPPLPLRKNPAPEERLLRIAKGED